MRRLRSSLAPALCALATLLAGAAGDGIQAGIDSRIEVAWAEAVALSGAEQARLTCPPVYFETEAVGVPSPLLAEYLPFAHEVRIYRSGAAPLHTLLVHEFLHSIYYGMNAATLTLSQLQQEDPSEEWVRGRMAHAP